MAFTPQLARAIVGAALLPSAALPFAPAIGQTMPSPTVAGKLRDLTTDRPDTTESPFTIDRGHLQIEMTIAGYGLSPRDPTGNATESFEFATTNFRVGLTPRLEFDFVLHPYGIVDPGRGQRTSMGVGAVDLRAKYNIWGNDGGSTALALLPYVTLPLDRDNGVGPVDTEYGLLVPLDMSLTSNIGLGLNAGFVVRRGDIGEDYNVAVPLTGSLAVDWTDRFGSYFEIATEVPVEGAAATSLNTGLTWRAREALQFDAGIGFGVTGDADRFAPFLGVTVRF